MLANIKVTQSYNRKLLFANETKTFTIMKFYTKNFAGYILFRKIAK